MIDEARPWDRRPDEPAMWFGRFDTLYRPLGTERSMLAAYNAWREEAGKGATTSIAKSWELNARKWEWKKRAEAWDAHERERRLVEEEQERVEKRRGRRAILQGLKAQIAKAIAQLDPSTCTVKDILNTVELVFDQERQEYDDLPTQRLEHSGPGGSELIVRIEGNIDAGRLRGESDA